MRITKRFVPFLLAVVVSPASAEVREYVRDYDYQANKFDSQYTARVNAIEGVKTNLLEELGTHIEQVININKDSSGAKFFSEDTVAMTAGIVKLKVLDEKWDFKDYYVKASMQADPKQVQKDVEALRNNHQLESTLRDTLKSLKRANEQIASLKQQLANSTDPAKRKTLTQDYLDQVKNVEAEEAFRALVQAQVSGDFDVAFSKVKTLADEGNAKAQTRIGFLYLHGMGVKLDYATARQWFVKAIQTGGDPSAYVGLGAIYEHSMGVTQDYGKAADLYREGMEKGSTAAYAFLGFMYQTGQGVPQDFEEAYKLYKKGDKLGDAWAQARLGAYYMLGTFSVKQDYAKAREYFEKAAKVKNPLAMAFLGFMNLKGWGGGEDDALGKALIDESLRYNNPLALSYKGFMYDEGIGEEQDYDKAVDYYKKSVAIGSVFGEFRLGLMYLKGHGVSQDRDTGLAYLKKAADRGHPIAKKVYDRVSSNW